MGCHSDGSVGGYHWGVELLLEFVVAVYVLCYSHQCE